MGNAFLGAMFEGPSGALSYTKDEGRDFPSAACRIAGGSTRCYGLQDLMAGDLPESVAEDRHGVLWDGWRRDAAPPNA